MNRSNNAAESSDQTIKLPNVGVDNAYFGIKEGSARAVGSKTMSLAAREAYATARRAGDHQTIPKVKTGARP